MKKNQIKFTYFLALVMLLSISCSKTEDDDSTDSTDDNSTLKEWHLKKTEVPSFNDLIIGEFLYDSDMNVISYTNEGGYSDFDYKIYYTSQNQIDSVIVRENNQQISTKYYYYDSSGKLIKIREIGKILQNDSTIYMYNYTGDKISTINIYQVYGYYKEERFTLTYTDDNVTDLLFEGRNTGTPFDIIESYSPISFDDKRNPYYNHCFLGILNVDNVPLIYSKNNITSMNGSTSEYEYIHQNPKIETSKFWGSTTVHTYTYVEE